MTVLLVIIQCAFAAIATAQTDEWAGCARSPANYLFAETGEPFGDPSPIPVHVSARERLNNFGIPLAENSLLAALRNENAEIRYSAAWQLADQNAKDAIPAIADALAIERVSRAKAYMACALIELGDQSGVHALHGYCDDSNFPADVKLDVADFLLEIHEQSCPRAVVEGFASGFTSQAESTMEYFYDVSRDQYAELRRLLLNDRNLGVVKLHVVDEIAYLRDVDAIPDLESAIPEEDDYFVRFEMERVLKQLQQQAAPKPEAASPSSSAHPQ